MIYLVLFLTFLKIGLFSFGGGYGMLPLMEQETVGRGWLTEQQFMNFLAISESTPGPISINMATFIGTSQGGVLGAILCTLGAITPSIVVILLIVAVFKKFLSYKSVRCVLDGIKPVICGLIFSTGIYFLLKNVFPEIGSLNFGVFDYKSLILTAGLAIVFFVYKKLRKKNLSPIILIVLSAVIGLIIF